MNREKFIELAALAAIGSAVGLTAGAVTNNQERRPKLILKIDDSCFEPGTPGYAKGPNSDDLLRPGFQYTEFGPKEGTTRIRISPNLATSELRISCKDSSTTR